MQPNTKWTFVTKRFELGKKAEVHACQFLQAKGLKLVQQNYRCYFGEIDLIMQDKEDIVFIEVRSRSQASHGSALESINKGKIKKIITTARYYLQMTKCLYSINSRFDIIAINLVNGKMQPEWIKNAFGIEYFS